MNNVDEDGEEFDEDEEDEDDDIDLEEEKTKKQNETNLRKKQLNISNAMSVISTHEQKQLLN